MTHAERWAPYHRAMAYKFTLQRDMYRAEAVAARLYPDGRETEIASYLDDRAVWCEERAAEHAKRGELGEGGTAGRSQAPAVIEPGGEAVPLVPGSQEAA